MDDDRSNADSPDSHWVAPVVLEVSSDIRQAAAQIVKGITVEEVNGGGDQWELPTHIVLRPTTFTADSRPPGQDDNSAFEENSFDSHAEACVLREEQRSQVEILDDHHENYYSTKGQCVQQSFLILDDQMDLANSPEIDADGHSAEILPVRKAGSNSQIGILLEDPDAAYLRCKDVNGSQIRTLEEHRAGTRTPQDEISHVKSQLNVSKESMEHGKEEVFRLCRKWDDREGELQTRSVQCQLQTERLGMAEFEMKELQLKIAAVEREKEELRLDSDRRLNSACCQLNELESTVHRLESEVANLEEERDSLSTVIERQQKRLESAMSQLNEMEHALTVSEEDLTTAEYRINMLEGRIHEISNQNPSV
jgi:predicted nuclease with TOPRIM domain